MKRILALALLLALLLTGCSGAHGSEPEAVTLTYYTIGEPDRDLKRVNDALNELLFPRYGFRVEYRKIGWNEYESRLSTLVNTNQSFDIAFTWAGNYQSIAAQGKWLDLTPYLETSGSAMYRAIDEKFWKGVVVDGKICGVPTNKELGTPMQFLFDRRLVEKYDIDISDYTTLASLEPLLRMISEREPDYIPFFLDSTQYNFMLPAGYEYITYDTIPLVVRSDDPECRVVNPFETKEIMDELYLMHRYYTLGYINQDACIRTSLSRFEGEKVFLRIARGGPDADASYTGTFGYPIIVQQASASVATTDSTRGGIMAVNAATKHPEQCVAFLNAVNTDPDVRNLLNYGIEGVHYTLTDAGQVHVTSDAYAGVTYTQGNWFLLRTREDENPDRWEIFKEFNEATQESALLGFVPDYSRHALQFDKIARIYERYNSALITGTVSPRGNVEQMNRELADAGLAELQALLQSQIDRWLYEQQQNPSVLP